ncbi:hypothetical protein THICB2_880018 [Thiomonas sp. CB2]|nr:hypothetical protein THICB2_880018 [Thiomonas sp. CB2]VDY19335.1 protein of unknown function [Thiomonas sp. CB2]
MPLPNPTALLSSHAGLVTALQIVAVVCGLLGQLLLALKRRSAFWIWGRLRKRKIKHVKPVAAAVGA